MDPKSSPSVDGEFTIEHAFVQPVREKDFCLEQIKLLEKERAKYEKDLKKIQTSPAYTVRITVEYDGKVMPITGYDGKEYPEISYETEGDTVSSMLSQAAIFLKNLMGSKKNETVRYGSLMHGVDKQIAAYRKRIEKAQRHIDEANRRAL